MPYFLTYYALQNKSNKTSEFYLDGFNDNLSKNDHDCSYPPPERRKKIQLMVSRETMQWRQVRRII